MRMRIANVTEGQLEKCIDYKVWGSRQMFRHWEPGDLLVLMVDKHIAAVARVSDPPTLSTLQVWDNGLFPYRVPLKFTHILLPEDRIQFTGKIKDSFLKAYGSRYGYVLLNKQILTTEIAELILDKVNQKPNSLSKK